jgi:two-component system OmpR family response regulator
MHTRLLLVDDDRSLSMLLKEYLEAKDYQCDLFHNGFDAFEAFKKNDYSLCVLDVRMPMKSGLQLAEEIQSINPKIPFLFLSGQTEKEDRIKGLEAGADDYIVKPFSMQEVYLRIKAILKRIEISFDIQAKPSVFDIGDYTFITDVRELRYKEESFKLSDIECRLLTMFCEAPDGVISRENALKKIWTDENMFRERSLNVYVSKLRGFMKKDTRIEFLNIHGSGYKLIINR